MQRLQVSVNSICMYTKINLCTCRSKVFPFFNFQESLMAALHSAAAKRPTIKVNKLIITNVITLINCLSTDTTVRIEASTEAEMEEREGHRLAF